MNYTSDFMKVFQGLRNLYYHVTAQILAEVCQPHNLMEQLPSGAKFQDNVIILSRLGKVNQLDNVWVINLAHNLDFLENIGSLRMTAWS